MKRITVMLAAVLVCAALASPAAAERENSLRDGAWALQFSINGGDFFSLSSFAGGVSVKHHFSPKSAIRAGASFGVSSGSATSSSGREGEGDNRAVSLSTLYQRYVNPTADANLYWGVGPYVRYEDGVQEAQAGDSLTTVSESESWGTGLSVVLGVEWFAARGSVFTPSMKPRRGIHGWVRAPNTDAWASLQLGARLSPMAGASVRAAQFGSD